jgi:hypothetical protein
MLTTDDRPVNENAVWVNGVQLTSGTLVPQSSITSSHEPYYATDRFINGTRLTVGRNVVAVKLKNSGGSSDTYIDYFVGLDLYVAQFHANDGWSCQLADLNNEVCRAEPACAFKNNKVVV